jgi:DNA polymerase I
VSAAALLRSLRDQGVELWSEDGSLRYRGPKNVITPALEELKAHKPDVLRLLAQLVDTPGTAELCLAWLESVPRVALDIETYSTPAGFAAHFTLGKARLITFAHAGTVRSVDVESVEPTTVRRMLETIAHKPLYLHNATFDLPRLHRLTGVLLADNVYDTLIASKIARAGEWEKNSKGKIVKKLHGLDALLKRELDVAISKDKRLKWAGEITEAHLFYAADDVIYLEDLHEALVCVLKEHSILDRYEAIRAVLPVFIEAAAQGVPVNTERLEELIRTAAAEEQRLLAEVNRLAPEHPDGGQWVWKNKNKPTAEDKHGNRIGRNGALRALSLLGVDLPNLQTDSTLVRRRDDHPLVTVLRDYYKAADEHSHYHKWPAEFIEGGRLFSQPKVAGAVTGRVLYTDPNIQGIQKRKTTKYREVIEAPPGWSIVAGDFAQQELRIAAYFSQDEAMLDAFSQGDFYTRTAEKMTGRAITDKKDPARAAAKRATLGFLYGLGIPKYRENVFKDTRMSLSKTQASKDREVFRATFPRFYEWQKSYGSDGAWTTRSVLGWRRHVDAQRDDKTGRLKPKYTDRLNGPIQSTAGDILYLALAKLRDDQDQYPEARFLMDVHDELVLEAPTEQAEDVARWLKEIMVSAFEEVIGPELSGPKSVEVGYGPSWGEQTDLQR